MDQQQDHTAIARTIIDSNMYMVLGTADESGQPWASPVYYDPAEYKEFYWVSSPEVRHSRNIAVRSQVSIVIFDSHAPIGTGQGVYMSALATQLIGADLDRGIEIFSRTSLAHGGHEWKREDVGASTLYRLYRAIASEYWIRDPVGRPDHRVPVTLQNKNFKKGDVMTQPTKQNAALERLSVFIGDCNREIISMSFDPDAIMRHVKK